MNRPPILGVRLKLTLSYAGFLLVAGTLLLGAAWVFLLRDQPVSIFFPNLSDFLRAFDPSNFGPIVFGAAAVAALVFLLFFGLVGGWVLAGKMLAPLARITEATRTAAGGKLSHRIGLDGPRDEFRLLADSFDAMLAQLEAHVSEQQRFAANASHELRTPLSVSHTLLEVAQKDPERDIDELIQRLQTVNRRAVDLTEALLMLSRADQRSFASESVDVSFLLEEAAETLLPFAERRGVTVDIPSGDASVAGSQALLLQMTTNLLHNAIVHNSPEQGYVWVKTRPRPNAVTLTVENTGAILAEESVALLVEPFQRGSGRIRTEDGGAGLGLAIVKSIVEAHAGTLTLTPRASGGLLVTVILPTDPQSSAS